MYSCRGICLLCSILNLYRHHRRYLTSHSSQAIPRLERIVRIKFLRFLVYIFIIDNIIDFKNPRFPLQKPSYLNQFFKLLRKISFTAVPKSGQYLVQPYTVPTSNPDPIVIEIAGHAVLKCLYKGTEQRLRRQWCLLEIPDRRPFEYIKKQEPHRTSYLSKYSPRLII